MAYQTYRVGLDAALAVQLADFAHIWQQSQSAILRDALRYLLSHPHLYGQMLSARLGQVDTRTPEQRRNSEAYMQALGITDIASLGLGITDIASLGLPSLDARGVQ